MKLFIRQIEGENWESGLQNTFYLYIKDTDITSRLHREGIASYVLDDLKTEDEDDWSSFVYDSLEA